MVNKPSAPEESLTYAVVGAGPSGLAAARNLQKAGLPWTGYELAGGVGGLWDIEGPRSTVYESAHLISSKGTTQFTEHPMRDEVADYPSHRELLTYFRSFADRFSLADGFRFRTEVTRVTPAAQGGYDVTSVGPDGERTVRHAGVLVCNGTLSEPNVPAFEGSFDGELVHTSQYKSATVFAGRRVLIIGAGNSGCDIAVDAVHHAAAVDISVRRGYHFVPKYLFGKPSDSLNQGKPLPPRIKQAIDSRVLRMFTGDPSRFGWPQPDHKLYESHPIVNSLILHHLGHGDLAVKADVARFDGSTVHFRDGSAGEYDVVVLATGYRLHYPFLDPTLLRWKPPAAPDLYLNIVNPDQPGLFVLGMLEASGIGWQGRYEQAALVASYLAASHDVQDAFDARARGPRPDLSGGYHYLGPDQGFERMAYYVNKDAYRTAVRREIELLGGTS